MPDSNLTLAAPVDASRRLFLSGLGKSTLSATAVGLIVGCESLAGKMSTGRMADPEQDAAILNVALGLEHEAINAYQLGAESGLLQREVLSVAVLFQGHHKAHRDALAATVGKLGGTPVEPKRLSEYAMDLQANTLKNQTDVLMLAARLELGAANAYLGVIPPSPTPPWRRSPAVLRPTRPCIGRFWRTLWANLSPSRP